MRVLAAAVAATAAFNSLGGARQLQAQLRSTLDLGGATVRYDDSVHVTATTLTPRIRFEDGLLAGTAVGTLASLTEGGWTAQGALDLSILSGSVGPTRLELAAEAGGSFHDDETRTGQYLGRARLHIGATTMGLWAGATSGKTWDASFWHPIIQGDFGAWARVGALEIVASVTPSAVGELLCYTDTQGALRLDAYRVELALGIGVRRGDALVRKSRPTWGSATATFWFTRHVGVIAAGGTYPVDFTQGYPGGRYLSLALRLGSGAPAVLPRQSRARSASARYWEIRAPRLEIVVMPNGGRTIRLHAPGARSVEVMGDFTNWQPFTLTTAPDGWWIAARPIDPGRYQLNVRVDGAAWSVPAGVPETVDEFGTPVGVLDLR